MKRYLTLLSIGALVCTPVFGDERIALELGRGFHWSKNADATFVRYSNDLQYPNYPKQEGFYEISLGHWKGRYPDTAVALAIGARKRWDRFHFDGSAGVAYLQNTTHLSGTHEEFQLRLGVGYTVGKFDFSIFQTHYSNAKLIFDWNGKNVGYDFLTFQVSYPLK